MSEKTPVALLTGFLGSGKTTLLQRLLSRPELGETVERAGYRLVARSVRHRGPSIAWALVEDGRPGVFDASLADELGVPHGPERGALLRGAEVTLADGRAIGPEQLVGPARRGRSVVLTGDTVPCNAVVELAAGADLLVHEATFAGEESVSQSRATSSSVGPICMPDCDSDAGRKLSRIDAGSLGAPSAL